MKMRFLTGLAAGMLLLIVTASAWPASPPSALPETDTLRGWIAEMKQAPRGPFARLRWFCNDGTVHPPVPYACGEHGGGVQHGEWSERVKRLRAHGYFVGNVLADIDAAEFFKRPDAETVLKQILLEQFLIDADDGWIFRRARYYRGALQVEDEEAHGRGLLLALVRQPDWRTARFAVLREAVRLIPHGRAGAPVTEMRQLSRAIAEKDPGFESLRAKLHVRPEPGDAAGMRDYARLPGRRALAADYERLARLIDEVYRPRDLAAALQRSATKVADPELVRTLRELASRLAEPQDLHSRHETVARLLALLRNRLAEAGDAGAMLEWLELSLDAEGECLRLGGEFTERQAEYTRRQRLAWVQSGITVLYGMGLVDSRQRQALQESLDGLPKGQPELIGFRTELDYLARMADWADRSLGFHFGIEIEHLARLEPLVRNYRHDRLRGSPLLFTVAVLDSLQLDANRQLDVHHVILGEVQAGGVRGLNPGLARGTLHLARPGERVKAFERKGIYVLEEAMADLPPVAGIVTAGPANPLSHVQLLARNLGIPNAAIDDRLISRLAAAEGRRVVLAVSPMGVVRLAEEGPEWDAVPAGKETREELLIRPDLARLDLMLREILPLVRLRSADAGRIAGPKAANLGELKRHFPEAVPDGVVIPFGVFRELLDRPLEPGGETVFRWLRGEYAALARIDDPRQREAVAGRFLRRLREWIETAELGDDFRQRLRAEMTRAFGPGEDYGVFVRSDTNIEDLPGFTGAGLNLTVPNVVGFEQVLEAIRRVWASPFGERAYRWRQAQMEQPEHVYPSVLLMRSVPAEKSGVMVTADVATGRRGFLTVAANEGVGGAVEGQAAEELLVELKSGRVRLLAPAAEPQRRVLPASGGVASAPASGGEAVLTPEEIGRLVRLAGELPERFPALVDAEGRPAPADIEYGFLEGRLALFQIRPFLESPRARRSEYLNRLDRELRRAPSRRVDLEGIPEEER